MKAERADLWNQGLDDGDAVPEAVHYDDAPADEPETEDDGGVSDNERIVRVWVEDGRLVKVRVSPNWDTKLQRRRDVTLSQVVTAVLQVAHVGVAEPGSGGAPVVDLTTTFKRSLPELTDGTLNRMDEHYEALFERFAAAKREAKPAAPRPEVVGRSKGVTVKLNHNGHASAVEFDERWLDSAQAGEISSQIMKAAHLAYDRFVPEPDDELMPQMEREFSYMRQVMYAMMTPKERR